MDAGNVVESDLAERQEQTPQKPQEPSALRILTELQAGGLSLDDIAARSDVPRRTLDDILYGRSSGVRTLPKLQPLALEVRRQQGERSLFEQLRDRVRQQVLEEQFAQLMKTARAAAEMEIAAHERELEQQLYVAAVRYLGKKGEALDAVGGRTPAGRQMVLQLAQWERAASEAAATRASPSLLQPGRHALADGGRRGATQRQLAAPTRDSVEHTARHEPRRGNRVPSWTPGQPLTQAVLVAAHGADCRCTTCALAPWRRRASS